MESFATAVALAVLVASVVLWHAAWRRWRLGQPWVVPSDHSPVPWGLVDLGLAIAIFMTVHLALASLLTTGAIDEQPSNGSEIEGSDQRRILLWSAAATAVVCLLTVFALRWRHGVTLRELGWSWNAFLGDVVLGATAFAMLAPIVYGIQRLLTYFVESEHPLIELLRQNPRLDFFVAAILAAAVVAPVAEEFLYRVLIQGWLERLFSRPALASEILMFGGRLPAGDVPGKADVAERPRFAPIGISSLLFALSHWSHGPDPIPLFVFAVGLGFLYQRTGRIVPCIVLHFLLNVTSLFALWLIVTRGN